MSQTPIGITPSLEEILKQIARRLERIEQTAVEIKLEVSAVKTQVEGLENNLNEIKKRVSQLEDPKERQISTLIIFLGSFLTAALHFCRSGNNP